MVWDGCGFALNREPAYERWFLPFLVRTSVLAGRMESLKPEAFLAHPPAAVVFNARLYNWCAEFHDLEKVLLRNYLPFWPQLWVPAPNGRLGPDVQTQNWKILRSGIYRIVASHQLAEHPWFHHPSDYRIISEIQRPGVQVDLEPESNILPSGLELSLDGEFLEPAVWQKLDLKIGQNLEARWCGQGYLGIMIAPKNIPSLFMPARCPRGIDPGLYTYYHQ